MEEEIPLLRQLIILVFGGSHSFTEQSGSPFSVLKCHLFIFFFWGGRWYLNMANNCWLQKNLRRPSTATPPPPPLSPSSGTWRVGGILSIMDHTGRVDPGVWETGFQVPSSMRLPPCKLENAGKANCKQSLEPNAEGHTTTLLTGICTGLSLNCPKCGKGGWGVFPRQSESLLQLFTLTLRARVYMY